MTPINWLEGNVGQNTYAIGLTDRTLDIFTYIEIVIRLLSVIRIIEVRKHCKRLKKAKKHTEREYLDGYL